jgi:prophage DNA circulation protein
MSSWRDNLRDASFRGVAFHVSSQDTTGGRRNVTHEYPLRDDPYVEDLGAKGKRWTLECYVIGDDYMTARDRLQDALDAEGAGALVIPWKGTVQAAVEEYRMRESIKEGGWAKFTVQFLLTGQSAQPSSTVATSAAVTTASAAASEQAQGEFADSWSVSSGLPEWVRTKAVSKVLAVISTVQKVAALAALPASILARVTSLAAAFKSEAESLISTPEKLAARMAALLESFFLSSSSSTSSYSVTSATDSVASSSDGWAAQSALAALAAELGASDSSTTSTTSTSTENKAVVVDNSAALDTLVATLAVVQAAEASADMEFESSDQAEELMEALSEALDETAATASDDMYLTLTDLRTAVVQDISARGADLASLKAYTPAATLPALVIAHSIYGDATREDEIVSRNNVRHPGAVPGGQALEVLDA